MGSRCTVSKAMKELNLTTPMNYRDAGVDIEKGDALVERIKPFAAQTSRAGVLAGLGGFGGLFALGNKYRDPVLVSGTDGVGTKLKLAFQMQRHDTIGIDLVAMSVNDILVQGAEPLFFLDYFACSKLDVDTASEVVRGIAQGCKEAGCALLGGETAEMPGMYAAQEYDLAGFAVGVVEKEDLIAGKNIAPGDILLGLASSGPHSNGYSLIRKIIEVSGADLNRPFQNSSLGLTLLAPTRIYVKSILNLLGKVRIKGMAHITGGGLTENTPRMLPDNLSASIDSHAWPRPAIFSWLQEQGTISDTEMLRTFNCGIGMVIALAPQDAATARELLTASGEQVWEIGRIKARTAEGAGTVYL